MRDFTEDIAALRERLTQAHGYLRIDALGDRLVQLESDASRPDLWDDPAQARKVTSELSNVQDDLEIHRSLEEGIDDAATLFELATEEGDDSLEAEVEETIELMGEDYWPYGIERNVKSIETMARYSHEQGLSKRLLTIEDLFAPETLEQSKS